MTSSAVPGSPTQGAGPFRPETTPAARVDDYDSVRRLVKVKQRALDTTDWRVQSGCQRVHFATLGICDCFSPSSSPRSSPRLARRKDRRSASVNASPRRPLLPPSALMTAATARVSWICWCIQGNGNSAGGGTHGGFGYWYSYRWATYGNITLTVEYDSARNTAKIRGREISLRDTNVVLMDGVDTANPTLIGSRWIDPQPFRTGDPVSNARLMKSSPELLDFLRCDLTLSDTAMQTIMALICARMPP